MVLLDTFFKVLVPVAEIMETAALLVKIESVTSAPPSWFPWIERLTTLAVLLIPVNVPAPVAFELIDLMMLLLIFKLVTIAWFTIILKVGIPFNATFQLLMVLSLIFMVAGANATPVHPDLIPSNVNVLVIPLASALSVMMLLLIFVVKLLVGMAL